MIANPIDIGTQQSAASAFTLTTTAAVAAGDAIVVYGYANGSSGHAVSVTDAASDAFTVLSTYDGIGYTFLAYCLNSAGMASSGSITFNGGGSGATILAMGAVKIPGGLTAFDESATNSGTGTSSLSSGTTAVTTTATEIAIGVFGYYNSGVSGQTLTAEVGYTIVTQIAVSGQTYTWLGALEYNQLSSTGSQRAAALASTAATNYGGVIATFTGPVTASGGVVPSVPTMPTMPTVGGFV